MNRGFFISSNFLTSNFAYNFYICIIDKMPSPAWCERARLKIFATSCRVRLVFRARYAAVLVLLYIGCDFCPVVELKIPEFIEGLTL